MTSKSSYDTQGVSSGISILLLFYFMLMKSYNISFFISAWLILGFLIVAGTIYSMVISITNLDFSSDYETLTDREKEQKQFDRSIIIYASITFLVSFTTLIIYITTKINPQQIFFPTMVIYFLLAFFIYCMYGSSSGLAVTKSLFAKGLRLAIRAFASGAYLRYCITIIIYMFTFIIIKNSLCGQFNTLTLEPTRYNKVFNSVSDYIFTMLSSIVSYMFYINLFQSSWVFPEDNHNRIDPVSMFLFMFIITIIFTMMTKNIYGLTLFIMFVLIVFFTGQYDTPDNYSLVKEVEAINLFGIDPTILGMIVLFLSIVLVVNTDWKYVVGSDVSMTECKLKLVNPR